MLDASTSGVYAHLLPGDRVYVRSGNLEDARGMFIRTQDDAALVLMDRGPHVPMSRPLWFALSELEMDDQVV